MTTDDERARKIAEAKARAEAARAARAGGATPPQEAEAPAAPAPPAAEPVVVQAQEQAPPAAVPAADDGADERARKIAEAKARAEAARAAREGGAPAATPAATPPAAETPPAAVPAAEAAPAVAAASAAPPSADERARRIEEAKARAAAARSAAGKEPAAAPAAAVPAQPAATPAAPRQAAAAAAPAAVIAPADGWKGEAVAPNRVLTARAETRAVMRRELQEQEVRNLYTRRSLVRSSFWAALGVTITGLLLGFVNFFWPREVTGFGAPVRIDASQIPPPGSEPKRFPEFKLYLVNLEPGEGVPPQFQALAAPSERGGLLALWQKCPHLGCAVPWRGEFDFEGVRGWFRCPCHGSTYTKAGIRVFGPAPRPMDTFALEYNADGSITVNTGQVTPGGPDNPQRAVLA